MKVITKIDGIDLLKMIANDELECGTMIRYKKNDLVLTSNPPQPVYEYYKYTARDKKFHRCDENGKLGAKGQQRFINYSTLNKVFEIVEIEENKETEELNLKYDIKYNNEYIFREQIISYCDNLQYKINELVKAVINLKEDK